MKRRTAYKVARAMYRGESTHNPETQKRALRVVKRDVNAGRIDGWTYHLTASGQGLQDLSTALGGFVSAMQRAAAVLRAAL